MIQVIQSIAHFASTQSDLVCKGAAATAAQSGCSGDGLTNGFHTIANVLIFLVGAISVLMVIIGGLRYVLSGGDSAGIKSAKDTILYALIGVVVALLAFALVSYVAGRFA